MNNNISKSNFSGGTVGAPAGGVSVNSVSPPPVPTAVTLSGQSQMGGGSSFSQTAAAGTPVGHTSTSFTPPTSFPRQQFPSSGMYGWY